MIVRYYEFFRIEDFNHDSDTIDTRMAISMLLNKNILPEIDSLRKRINLIGKDLTQSQRPIFRLLGIYYWKKSRNRLYILIL